MKVLILAVKEKGNRHTRWMAPLESINGVTCKLILKSTSYIPFLFRALRETFQFKPHIIMSIGPDLLGAISILINKFVLHQAVILSLGGDPIIARLDLLSAMNKMQIANKYKQKLLCYLNRHYVFKNCCYFMVNSHCLRDRLLKDYPQFMNKDIFVVPQPMKVITTSKQNVLRSKAGCIRLLTVTNLTYRAKYYGVLELIEFLQKYAGKISLTHKLVFDICGGGTFEYYLRKRLKLMTTSQDKLSIRYLGFVENLKPIYETAHLFMYSSNLDSLPRVLLEAQASGLPILANDFDPFREVVRNDYNGLLYKSGDFPDFQDKLNRLVTDPYLRYRLGKNSLENVKRNYSIETVGEKIERFLFEVLIPKRQNKKTFENEVSSRPHINSSFPNFQRK